LDKNFHTFSESYDKSRCNCENLLEKTFKTYTDSLIKHNQYEEVRTLLIDYPTILDIQSFNYRLKIAVEKDVTIEKEFKDEFFKEYSRKK
jgi:hypothetical protein